MSRLLCENPASSHKVTQCPLMFLLLGKHVVVHVIMLCFKRQLWFQNRIWVSGRWRGMGKGMFHGRCSVKLVLGTGGEIPCHDRC